MWLALTLAITLPKTNRDGRILLILVPLAIVNLLYVAMKRLSGMPPAAALQFDTFFQSLAVGVAVLWLLAPRLASLSGFVRFLMSLGIVAGVALLGALSIGLNASEQTMVMSLFLVLVEAVLLLAIVAAARLCHWRYRPGRFMLWLGLCEATANTLAMLAFVLIGTTVTLSRPPNIWTAIPQIVLVGLIFGLCLYVLTLPFMILGFANPFFRDRMRACLNLNTPAEPLGSSTPSDQDGAAPDNPGIDPASGQQTEPNSDSSR